MYQNIIYEVDGPIASLTINRPERRNSVTLDTIAEIKDAVRCVNEDKQVRVVIFTGAGNAFCAGADLKDFPEAMTHDFAFSMARSYLDYYLAIRSLEVPVIARINGDAIGGGAGASLVCDIRIAVDRARFGWPFVNIGLAAADAGSTYFLPRVVGYGRATELLMTGRLIDSREALEMGIIHQVVSDEELDAEVQRLAERFAVGPPKAYKYTKAALANALDQDIKSEFDYEHLVAVDCILGDEFREGTQAFREKRQPDFPGRK